jgi:long-chain fatty acid transport protein
MIRNDANRTFMRRQLLLLPLGMLMAAPSQGAGLYLYETGTNDLGLATAGMAARAQDATVQFMNPAGLSHLEGRNLTVAGQMLYGDAPYDLDDPTQEDIDTVIGWFPGASFYYSQQLDDRWTLGFASYGNFGLGLDYGDWAGKQLIKEATLIGLTLQPSLAYRIDDHWSVGAGLGINYGLFALKREDSQGEQKQDDTDWAFNAKLGVLYELNSATRFGLGYSSEMQYHFDIDREVSFQRPNQPTVNATLPIASLVNSPQQLMLSGYHEFAPDWAIMGNLGWQDWSRYNDNQVTVFDRPLAAAILYQDTYHLAAGVQHKLTPQWTLNGGLAYDSSAYRDQNNTALTVPSGAALRLGTGATYAFNAQDTLGAGFEYVHVESASVQEGSLSGRYPSPALYFFAVNYNTRF